MIYRFTVEGLKLPTVNDLLRAKRGVGYSVNGKRYEYNLGMHIEAKRIREAVGLAALQHGLSNATPCRIAMVRITINGPYRRDWDGHMLSVKNLLDAIVARRLGSPEDGELYHERRWGLILDDSPRCIGAPIVLVERRKRYAVEFEVTEVGTEEGASSGDTISSVPVLP